MAEGGSLYDRILIVHEEPFLKGLRDLHEAGDVTGFLRHLRGSPVVGSYLRGLLGSVGADCCLREGMKKARKKAYDAFVAADLAKSKGKNREALRLVNRAILLQPEVSTLWELYRFRAPLLRSVKEIERMIADHPKDNEIDETHIARLYAMRLEWSEEEPVAVVEEIFFKFLENTRLTGSGLRTAAEDLYAILKRRQQRGGVKGRVDDNGISTTTHTKKYKILFAPDRGRHWVATAKIAPCEILCVEEPRFVHCLANVMDSDVFRCDGCCVRTDAPLPCPKCSKICFCSTCFASGTYKAHLMKCNFQVLLDELRPASSLGSSQVCDVVDLAFDVVAAKPLQFFRENREALFDARNRVIPSMSELERHIQFFSLTSVLDGLTIQRSVHVGAAAFLLADILAIGGYFEDSGEGLNSDLCLVELLLYKSLFITSINALPVGIKPLVSPLAFGIFPTAVYLNHSCAPNALLTWCGTKVVVYVSRPIVKGEEICIAYGQHTFYNTTMGNRRRILKEMFSFDCSCLACKNRWKVPQGQNYPPKSVICQRATCNAEIPFDENAKKCPTCKESAKGQKIAKKLSDILTNVGLAEAERDSGDVVSGLVRIQKTLEVASSILPIKEAPFVCLVKIMEHLFTTVHWKGD